MIGIVKKLIRDYRRTLAILSQRRRGRFGLMIVAGFIQALLEVAGILSIVPFLAVAIDQTLIDRSEILNWGYNLLNWGSTRNYLLALGLVLLLLLVARNVYGALFFYIRTRYITGTRHEVGTRLFSSYIHRTYSYFIVHDGSRLSKDVLNESYNASLSVSGLLEAITNALTALALLGMLTLFNPLVAIIVVGGLSGIYAILLLSLRRGLALLGKKNYWVEASSYKIVTEALTNIKNLKTYHCEQLFDSQYRSESQKKRRLDVQLDLTRELPHFLQEIIIIGGLMVVCLIIIAVRESFAEVLPIIGLYAYAGLRFKPAINRIFSQTTTWRGKLYSIDAIVRQMEEPLGVTNISQTMDVARLSFRDRLELSDVVMSYPRAELPALNGVSLSMPVRTTIGLVGGTGSGKTTIIDILLGLLEIQSGSLSVDDVVIEATNSRRWQANIGYVPQEIILTNATIFENIAFGIAEEDIDQQRVSVVAHIAGIGDFIEQDLPERYRTVVNDRGIRLSGGQRQRIGIARALYRDPEVLILDEATSALDPATERIVMDSIHNLGKSKTILICTHRIATLKNCDHIYVVEKGRIAADGSYAHLQEHSQSFRALSRTE